jgi:hypothetical protein
MSHKAYGHLGSRRNDFTFTFFNIIIGTDNEILISSCAVFVAVSQAILN